MTDRTRLLLILSIAALLAPSAVAQEGRIFLQIETNVRDADVLVDGVYVGPASLGLLSVAASSRELQLVARRRASWSVSPLTFPIPEVAPDDTIKAVLRFPYHYRLESTPSSASVFQTTDRGRTPLGLTPTTIESPEPLIGLIEFELDGFRLASAVPGSSLWNLHSVDLQSTDDGIEPSSLALSPPPTRRRWIDVAAVGTALVAGGLAVHFKFKADRRYDLYRETGDPALRPGVKRYDVYSGVALGFMQAGVTVFAVRLALR